MVRSIIITIAIILIITGASIFETNYLNSKIEYFDSEITTIITETENDNNNTDKLQNLIEWWKNEKKYLHAFVPHNEIQDIDGLMIESKNYIENNEYIFATTKLKKLDDMILALPDTFSFCLGNIF